MEIDGHSLLSAHSNATGSELWKLVRVAKLDGRIPISKVAHFLPLTLGACYRIDIDSSWFRNQILVDTEFLQTRISGFGAKLITKKILNRNADPESPFIHHF